MIKGIDISSNDTSLSMKYAKSLGYEYCYIKATEGKNYVEPIIAKEYKWAKDAGMKVGFYHYCNDSWSAEQQVENFKKAIAPYEQDLLPCLDIESYHGFNKSEQETTDFIYKFVDLLGGKDKAIVYTGLNYYKENTTDDINGLKMWIACYKSTEPKPEEAPTIKKCELVGWQYHDEGINGHTDVNYWYGDILIKKEAPKPTHEEHIYQSEYQNGDGNRAMYAESNFKTKLYAYLGPFEKCTALGYVEVDGKKATIVQYWSDYYKCYKIGYTFW